MQVKLSNNLERHMKLMRTLVDKLDKVFDYVSILGSDVSSRIYSTTSKGESVKDSEFFFRVWLCGSRL